MSNLIKLIEETVNKFVAHLSVTLGIDENDIHMAINSYKEKASNSKTVTKGSSTTTKGSTPTNSKTLTKGNTATKSSFATCSYVYQKGDKGGTLC